MKMIFFYFIFLMQILSTSCTQSFYDQCYQNIYDINQCRVLNILYGGIVFHEEKSSNKLDNLNNNIANINVKIVQNDIEMKNKADGIVKKTNEIYQKPDGILRFEQKIDKLQETIET